MKMDPKKNIQRLDLEGTRYVLVKEATYGALLDELESLDTALEAARSRWEASSRVVETLLSGKLSREQMHQVFSSASFGRRIQLLRGFQQMNQSELADKAGVSQTMVSNLENDKVERLNYRAVHDILSALQVPEGAQLSIIEGKRLEAGRAEHSPAVATSEG